MRRAMVPDRLWSSSVSSQIHSPPFEMKQSTKVIAVGSSNILIATGFNRCIVYLWKRAQILVAETWAAFHPLQPSHPHPIILPSRSIKELTMFADYRVPQILHHLRILTYPPSFIQLLIEGQPLEHGRREEVSLRSASVVAIERVRKRIIDMGGEEDVSSVLIDFYLWDLAKRIEGGEESIEGIIETVPIVPPHRTRSIWY